MQLLAVASEIYPLVKTGGLADVVGALPHALSLHGVATRTLVPGYPAVLAAIDGAVAVADFDDLFGGPARLLAGRAASLDLLVIDAPHLYTRPGNPYLGPDGMDWPDNDLRFAALGFVAGEIGLGRVPAFRPDIVHAHDWQAGLAAAYLRFGEGTPARSVITIHNLAFQGHFPATLFPRLGLPEAAFDVEGIEYFGGVGFLKGGIALSDAVTTVSPTYAEEIRTEAGGMGLDGLLRHRGDAFHGIVNGIDTSVWDPTIDPHLAKPFSADDPAGRDANRRALARKLGLTGRGMVLGVVSRLTWQKGLDLLADTIDEIVGLGARIAVLGSGDRLIEQRFQAAAAAHPGRIGVRIGYDEGLSRLVQAGSDAILVPSRFEPCGLTQLCGLRYGAVPIVSRVGGLADTVIDANDAAVTAGVATGIQMSAVDAPHLMRAIRRAIAYHADGEVWATMRRAGMRADVSWARSAARYTELYRSLITPARRRTEAP